MKSIQWILFFAVISVCFAATPVKKPVAKKAPVKSSGSHTTAPSKTLSRNSTSKTSAGNTKGRRTVYRKGKGVSQPVASSWRSRQATPTPDRYKEIQEALTAKGYLKSEPNGVWDAQSVEALRQYQADNNMQVTGKLTAPALIGLGLGPKRSSDPIVPSVESREPVAPPVASQP
jgi:hypothetical protein